MAITDHCTLIDKNQLILIGQPPLFPFASSQLAGHAWGTTQPEGAVA